MRNFLRFPTPKEPPIKEKKSSSRYSLVAHSGSSRITSGEHGFSGRSSTQVCRPSTFDLYYYDQEPTS